MNPSKNNDAPSEPVVIRENIESLSASLSDQVEMLAGELRSHWKSGKRVGVEQLGSAFEVVAKNEEQLLDLIYHEVLLREEFGEKPKLEDFTTRFPQHVDRLQRLFAVHGAIEDDGWDDELDSAFADDAATLMPDKLDRGDSPSSTEMGESGLRQKARWPRKSRDSRPVEPPPGYELLEEIGRGGMAVVFRAKQQILNRVVALKMLLAGGVASKEVLARVQQEAQAVAQLQHPGIVQIHEVGEHRGLPFLSLEYVAGGTLHEWLGGRPLPPLEAARVIEQLARTTQYAHERGVVHRDLKPANVLLTERPPSLLSSATIPMAQPSRNPSGEPTPTFTAQTKISDFGLARVLGSRSDLTATGQVIGTPSYMAPEQAAGTADDVSPAQDIYSLGAILYELLTGRPPFRGSSLFDTLEQVRTTEAVPPRQLQPRVPRDLETICLKCLEKLPERRYPTAAALAEDLRRVQDGDTISARPAGSIERTWKWVRRYPAVASLASLAVLLTVLGAAGIMREAQKAFESEQQAQREKWQAQQQREIAARERDEARAQRLRADEQRRIAEVARGDAEASQKKAEEQQQVAEQQRTRALQAQEQAEANLEQAFQTINTFAMFGYNLRHEPGMQSVSKRLLDNTLNLYEQLAQKQGDTSAARRQRIMALIAAGDVRRAMRQDEEAEKIFTQAVQLLDAELKVSPTDYQLHHLAANIFWPLGVLYKDTERPEQSLAAFQRDLEAHAVLLQQRPEDLERIVGKANILTNLCVAYKNLGRSSEALETYSEAIVALRGVLKKVPAHSSALNELALVRHDQSTLLQSLGHKDQALEAHQEAFDIRRQLQQRYPEYPMYRTFLARSHRTQAFYLQLDRKLDASLKEHQAALTLITPLIEKFPDIYDYQLDVINTLIGAIRVCQLADNAKDGRQLLEQLATRCSAALTKFPTDKTLLSLAGTWLLHWSNVLWEEGQKPAARVTAKQGLDASLFSLTQSSKSSDREVARLLNNTAWRLVIVADPALRDNNKSIELASRAVELEPESSYNWHTLGTALYRAEEFPAALEALLKSLRLEQEAAKRVPTERLAQALKELPNGDIAVVRQEFQTTFGLNKRVPHELSLHYALLAMTLWKLNDHESARKALSLVVDPPDRFDLDALEYRMLLKEARDLITPADKPSRSPTSSND